MFREIRVTERIEKNKEEERRNLAYLNIKPEKELSVKELNAIVYQEFMKAAKEG